MGNIFKQIADTKRGVKFDVRRAPQEPTDLSGIKMVEKPCAYCGTPRKVSENSTYPYCHRLCALKAHGPMVFKRGTNVKKLLDL